MSHSAQTLTHPLLIPQVLILVAEYFAGHEALAPSLVCRDWNQVFNTAVWRSVNIDLYYQWPSVDLIRQNAHHIRHLSYSGNISLPWYNLTCTHLVSLKICRPPRSEPRLWSLLSKQVLESHTLRFITLYELGDTPPSEFWLALGRCQNLKKLHIHKVKIDSQDFETFYRSCLRLQDLSVLELSINGPPPEVFFGHSADFFPNMERMRLHLLSDGDSIALNQMVMVLQCPNLRMYHLAKFVTRTLTLSEMSGIISGGGLQRLEHLIISRGVGFKDVELHAFLGEIPRLANLCITAGDFGHLSFQNLVRHFDTLSHLSLTRCKHVTGAMVQRVLESCPKLVYLAAPRIEASQIISRKRWLCLGLKVLRACIVLDSKDYSIGLQSRMVYVQLARLTQLKVLNIAPDRGKVVQSLDLRLSSGLYQLSSLTKLGELRYNGTIQSMSLEDVQWMQHHLKLKMYPDLSEQQE